MLKKVHTFNFVEGEMLLIDKPVNWTSFDVVNLLRSFIRKQYGLKKLKVGHAGTLDPLATGLLIICTGKLTKTIDDYQGMDKTYIGSMKMGSTTPSFDGETKPNAHFDTDNLTEAALLNASKRFVGNIEQVPPIYSAIKIDGKRAFEHARKNKEIVLKSRSVSIHLFDLYHIDLPNIDFSVTCSKGTYIRSLVNDFGKSLNNGAYLTDLRRTAIGEYTVADAFTLDEFKQKVLAQTESLAE
ncbi:MAG: tRNA pseudouridine(55) synthase TruB [Bacteroidales bacterium]|jgi:tRNA pseudouridine55 synthase|nr:tRNA pseudouridine(55) synthase TruB [Bacteroidales bacterium]